VPRRLTPALALVLAALLGGCATGQFIRVVWRGFTTAAGPECPRMEMTLVVEEGHITGWGDTDHPWGRTAWDATGTVSSEGQVTLQMSTRDPRVPLATIPWLGQAGVVALTLTEQASVCPTARFADLRQ
jgi:hypothetical protein